MLDAAVQELSQISERNREVEPKLNIGLAQIGLKAGPVLGTSGATRAIALPLSARSGSSNASGRSVDSGASKGSHASKHSQASKGSQASARRVNLGVDLGSDAGSAGGSVHSESSGRSTGSQRSTGSRRGRTAHGPRPVTPRRQGKITQPHVSRP